MRWWVLVSGLVACRQPAVAPAEPAEPQVFSVVHLGPDKPETYLDLAVEADTRGPLVRKPTAVLFIAVRNSYGFVPLVCSVNGELRTGIDCGFALPADELRVRTSAGVLTVRRERPQTDAGPRDFRPECITSRKRDGRTLLFASEQAELQTATQFAVWPVNADVDLRVEPTPTDQLDLPKGDQQANVLIATSDVDGDGIRERIIYELWAYDYGIEVVRGTEKLHRFSCGTI